MFSFAFFFVAFTTAAAAMCEDCVEEGENIDFAELSFPRKVRLTGGASTSGRPRRDGRIQLQLN